MPAQTLFTIGKIATIAARSAHLVVRREGILCTRCFEIEPVHVGDSGTPMSSLLYGFMTVAQRHQKCAPKKAGKKS